MEQQREEILNSIRRKDLNAIQRADLFFRRLLGDNAVRMYENNFCKKYLQDCAIYRQDHRKPPNSLTNVLRRLRRATDQVY